MDELDANVRYYAICCQPLVYRNKMTPLRIALMLGGCWVIPMFISFLPIMQGWNNIGITDLIEKRKFNQNSNATYCIFMVNKPYAITCSVVAFYIPFFLMVLAYYRIYVTAKEHAHQIQMLQRAGAPSEGRPQPADQHSTHRMRTETKAAKTLCIIMGCFCLCWAPFFVTNIVDPFVDYTVPGEVWTAFLWLGYINSGLNPFLYAFLNKSFRRAFLIILCCDDERYRRPSILGQTAPCSTTTINGSTHVLSATPLQDALHLFTMEETGTEICWRGTVSAATLEGSGDRQTTSPSPVPWFVVTGLSALRCFLSSPIGVWHLLPEILGQGWLHHRCVLKDF
ncbi:5-hydroxytryptamine receptor 4 isoform X4 [Elephas maximus indicus]|uniref:5-hydroxytryptamine receptor 4 isoform X4 n=1 Tax=Elephas maximus indicus TaxID=99487 RepID=UPI00211607FF|nr:5-hydroxytryptamine receptor 4 isoform X4 [Elephas maximus indicus]